MDLQPPSVLAQLPRPLHASTGKTHIGEVYSLAESKKRKRYEVAVAVDGEAVNIYNIQTPKLVTSYAVPPKSSFSCQPCSLRRKLPNGSGVRRQTYVATKKEIKSFLEESGGNGSTVPSISSSTFTLRDSNSPTVFIGVVPAVSGEDTEKEPFDVLAVHRDGRVRRLPPNLESQRWSIKHSEVGKGSPAHEVHTSFLLEFDDAKKALLKRRPDLVSLALGNLATPEGEGPSILLLVSSPAGSGRVKISDVKVQVFSIPAAASSQSKSLDESQNMRHLLTATLPDLDNSVKFEQSSLHWHFHSGSAGLNLSFNKGFISFDLSQYSPTVTSKFILDDEDFSSVMRTSPQTVIGAGESMVALYDTQYKSIQRSIVATDIPGGEDKARTTFISHFAKLDVVVAAKGNSLLAFDLATPQSSSGSAKRSLLVDAIGRGIGAAAQWDGALKKHRSNMMGALGLTSAEDVNKWTQFTKDLREYAASKDAGAFDRAVQTYFGVLPSPGQGVNLETILFLMSLIFSVDGQATNKDELAAASSIHLSIQLWPKQTCGWLIQLGYLSPGNVEASMRRSFKPRVLPPLPTGSFTQAIKDSDPSLHRLISVIQGPATFSADELAQILKIFLTMARSCSLPVEQEQEEEQAPLALTNGEDHKQSSPPPPPTPNGIPKETTELSIIPTPTPSPPATLQTIFLGLNTTLLKLYDHPDQATTSALRSTLSRTELISMIHHLRLSLATGGHTSRFTETPPTPITPHLTTPPLPLRIIVDLLNASVDAIGPSGWISATDLPDATPRDLALIAEMKSEVSAALAGIEEATFLSGILREYIRYVRSVSATTGLDDRAQELDERVGAGLSSSAAVRHEKLNGADLLVFGAAQDEHGDGDGDASGKLLPLSLKAVADVSKTKVNKSTGKVVERSKREIGYLRRKAAGKYTFERLVL